MIDKILNGVSMDLEEIESMWAVDSQIDKTKLVDESLQIDSLKQKYRKILTREALHYIRQQSSLKALELEKYEHYTQGGSKEAAKKGWKLPPIGKVLKTDVARYMEADKELIADKLKLAYQNEKIELLKDIANSLHQRSFNIKNAISHMNFMAGGSVG